jgi:hypothetical protein
MSMIPSRLTTALAAAAIIALTSATTGAIAASLITSADIRNDTIRSVDIHDGTIASEDLTASVDRQISVDRISGWHALVAADLVPAGKSIRVNAPCYGDTVVVGGGFRAPVGVEVVSSRPTASGNAWRLRFVNTTGADQHVEGWSACAKADRTSGARAAGSPK